jgi:hypothetical protein
MYLKAGNQISWYLQFIVEGTPLRVFLDLRARANG